MNNKRRERESFHNLEKGAAPSTHKYGILVQGVYHHTTEKSLLNWVSCFKKQLHSVWTKICSASLRSEKRLSKNETAGTDDA